MGKVRHIDSEEKEKLESRVSHLVKDLKIPGIRKEVSGRIIPKKTKVEYTFQVRFIVF
jgi:hypothetical protein